MPFTTPRARKGSTLAPCEGSALHGTLLGSIKCSSAADMAPDAGGRFTGVTMAAARIAAQQTLRCDDLPRATPERDAA